MKRRLLVAVTLVLGVLAQAEMSAACVLQARQSVCAHEYSSNCVWFGKFQGNHRGPWLVFNGPEEDR